MELVERFRGSLLGLAIGDALGYPTEFISSLDAIRSRFGIAGIEDFASVGLHSPGTFTDDTQMSIAVARALIRAGHLGLDEVMGVVAEEFIAWSTSADNNRAPGSACMNGCSSLRRGVAWREAGVAGSKGCGAAMRVAPIGLFCNQDQERMVLLAAAQSCLTHRHPTALTSAVAAAAAVAWVTRGNGLEGTVDFCRNSVELLDGEFLSQLGRESSTLDQFNSDEMLAALDRVESTLGQESDDVCRLLGGGWIGEEAVACALWCVIKSHGDFRTSVLRGANSSGDSDSIACIAGSIAGALGGIQAIPVRWATGVEKSTRLERLALTLEQVSRSKACVPEPDEDIAFFVAGIRTDETPQHLDFLIDDLKDEFDEDSNE